MTTITPARPIGRRFRRLATTGVAALVLAACGGGDSDSTPATDPPDETPDTTAGTTDDTEPETTEPGETLERGDVEFRVVNLRDEPADIYVRTSGLVTAELVESDLGPGEVSDFHAPPPDGVLVVTKAGAGDATCVTGCDFFAEVGGFEEEGPVHTVILYDADGSTGVLDLWEQPVGAPDVSNAMEPADPDAATIIVTAIDLEEDDFGLRLAYAGFDGCQDPTNLTNILVGGTQTPAFVFDPGTAEVVLHNNDDRDCVNDIVGGPFDVEGAAGSRTHVILTGSPGSMTAIVLPFADSTTDGGGAPDGDGEASSADRDLAIDLMSDALEEGLGLPADQADCAAPYLVDALGPDVLLDGDTLVDLDSLPVELDSVATDALVEAVPACGIDPAGL